MKNETKQEIRTQIIFIICFLAAWQIVYSMSVFPELIFPSLPDIGTAFVEGFRDGSLMSYTLYSMGLIIRGLVIGIVLAFVFSSLAIVSRIFHHIYNLIVSIMDLLPGVALLPLVIMWCGIGEAAIIVIVIHSILWPMSRSIMDGFKSISSIYIESGRNIGLKGLSLVRGVYIPAAFSGILSGMRDRLGRAWRGLISVEMIFGTTGAGAGIGWFIFLQRTNVHIAGVFAALIVIIIIGIIIEYGLFRTVERKTVKKWGMIR